MTAPRDRGAGQAFLNGLLAEGVALGAFPDAAAWIALDGHFVATGFAGAGTATTCWDLASLTKPILVATGAMRAVAGGQLQLDRPLSQGIAAGITPRALLAHRAGLVAWHDLARAPDIDATLRALVAARTPPTTVYSDIGYILLERALRPLLVNAPFRRFGLTRIAGGDFVANGTCDVRQRALYGEVNDSNAAALIAGDGHAGHAGLYATVDEVAAWALALARAADGLVPTSDPSPAQAWGQVDGGVVRDFWSPSQRLDSTWVLGWDTPSASGSTAGDKVSDCAVGHLGFTGTSVWIDRRQRLVAVLLTNRVAWGPQAKVALRSYRPFFHDALRRFWGLC